MVLDEFAKRLRVDERRAARAVFDIDLEAVDQVRSSVSENDEFLCCSIVSANDLRCSFEIHFGRGRSNGHFNFYIGYGAELYCYENLGPVSKQDALATDVEHFLRSRIICEVHLKGGVVLRAMYRGDVPMLDSLKLNVRFTDRVFPLWGHQKEVREYAPWLTPRTDVTA